VRVDISPVSALTRWEVAVAVDLAVIVPQTDASVTTVTRPDTCLVTALMPTGGRQTGAALSASGATRWVTLLVTVLTAAAVVALVDRLVAVVVAAVAAQTCVATTATRSDTSRATVPPSRSATVAARRRPVAAETYSKPTRDWTPTVTTSHCQQASPCLSVCPAADIEHRARTLLDWSSTIVRRRILL
jgi:hypothetical protein